MAEPRCLLVGPFPGWDVLAETARGRGWRVDSVQSGAEAFRALRTPDEPLAVVMPTDLRDGPADNLLLRARGTRTRADFLLISADAGEEERAALLSEGAEEVFELSAVPDRILRKLELLRDRRQLFDELGLVVRDPVMLELFERALRIAPLKVTALITGESGTGKEMLAQAIHRASDRREKPFVPVNVGALPESLLESELFGHERGAFTSADARRIGRFEMADGGTLFLDEIGEMSLASQVSLLRVLEDERFLRVGGSEPIRVDVRVVAATNRDLEGLVRDGKFRRDLFYRLNVVHLDVPPLRQRRSEIPLLVRSLADAAAARHGLAFPGFARDAMDVLTRYDWPGNVREVRNLVDGIVALEPAHRITAADLPGHLRGARAERSLPALRDDHALAEREFIVQSLLALRADFAALRELVLSGRTAFRESPIGDPRAVYPTRPVRVEAEDRDGLSLKDLERRAVERALNESAGNRRLAAEALGMSERTLYRRLKEYGLVDPDRA